MKPRILMVEDDAGLSGILRDNFVAEGYDVQCVVNGDSAVAKAREFAPDLILLDVGLPGSSGFDLCSVLRGRRRTPIVMLTARSDKRDKLKGLELGADDYITKPFDLQELLARIHAVLRRASQGVERLALGAVTIDFRRLQAWNSTGAIEFSHREFELLRYLAERSHKVVGRAELLHEIWGYLETPLTRSVDNAIVRLRRKVEPDPQHPRFIHTVHGDGYCLTPGK
jgi:two-component system response regulator VicR